jgi:hypothetical protein
MLAEGPEVLSESRFGLRHIGNRGEVATEEEHMLAAGLNWLWILIVIVVIAAVAWYFIRGRGTV